MSGCRTRRTPLPDDALTEPAQVLALVRAHAEGAGAIHSLSAEARVSFYSAHGARKGKMIILARRPASLHFSALSPTDDLVAFLASDGERFTSFERGSDVCEVGPACARNVGRLLPIPMEGAELVGLLVGQVPVIEHERAVMSWDARAGAYRLDLQDGARQQRLWVEHGSGAVRRVELWRGDEREVSVAYDDRHLHGGIDLPHEIRVEAARDAIDLKVRYREVELNGTLDDDAFAIPCPEGTRAVEAPCVGDEGG
ncbi:MAG: DUF4292 domain-containing protein [Deltaproteobacteria bacterium]|nr:DUF4292 domain-containing protein [Deltaproteobacteria bacterium]